MSMVLAAKAVLDRTLKLSCSDFSEGEYIRFDGSKWVDEKGEEFWSYFDEPDWYIYEEPKPKIKHYMYAAKSNGIWRTGSYFFKNDEDAKKHFECGIVKRLDFSMTEIDE